MIQVCQSGGKSLAPGYAPEDVTAEVLARYVWLVGVPRESRAEDRGGVQRGRGFGTLIAFDLAYIDKPNAQSGWVRRRRTSTSASCFNDRDGNADHRTVRNVSSGNTRAQRLHAMARTTGEGLASWAFIVCSQDPAGPAPTRS